jgi:phosphotransferase system  glucose/maltose/N-acetylglucosamine-specific IIC component
MEKIRKLLLTEYIGAITIGFLLAQAVIVFVGAFVGTAEYLLLDRSSSRSVFYNQAPLFSWATLIVPLVSAILYFTVAYLLMRWLYMRSENIEAAQTEADRS